MNQSEYRFILNVKNYIKKSISSVLLAAEPCGSVSGGVRWNSFWGIPNLLINGRDAIETKAKELDIEKSAFDEHVISQLFVGFFNNKMTLPMFLIQSSGAAPSAKLVDRKSTRLNSSHERRSRMPSSA